MPFPAKVRLLGMHGRPKAAANTMACLCGGKGINLACSLRLLKCNRFAVVCGNQRVGHTEAVTVSHRRLLGKQQACVQPVMFMAYQEST